MPLKQKNLRFRLSRTPARIFAVAVFLGAGLWLGARTASAASLSLSPGSGSFVVGSTFDVGVVVNTENQEINALQINLEFPADKLQVASPSTGRSIIGVWTTQPKYDNEKGTLQFIGGIPGGINTSNGIITTITFRVRAVGTAYLKFSDNTKVLLNDGQGTDALRNLSNGVYDLVLPPPAGPIVTSATHPDQTVWYANPNVSLNWVQPSGIPADGYSYLLSDEPVDTPDDIAEGGQTSVVYKNIADGVHYFHIKAFRNGAWGGITHFAVKVDTTPPAAFPVDIIPSAHTTRTQPIIQFSTTDANSGIDHYELKLVPLSAQASTGANGNQPLFVDVQSPYIPESLSLGSYDIIVRAYDRAGNYREVTQRLGVVSGVFRFFTEAGLEIAGVGTLGWLWLWLIAALVLAILVYVALRMRRRHGEADLARLNQQLPEYIQSRLEELKKYRAKYGGLSVLLGILLLGSLMGGHLAKAETNAVSTPTVTVASRSISNQEIFYIGGRTELPNTDVIIYIQDKSTDSTQSEKVTSDKQGLWFYRHNTFLAAGQYVLWVQSKIGDQLSAPSAQVTMDVSRAAIEFGSNRVSYDAIYLTLIVLLLLAFVGLLWYIIHHGRQARKKHEALEREIREAEEAVRRGFAVLKHDIEQEMAVIRRVKLNKKLTEEEQEKERQLLSDLEAIEQNIGKDIWDLEMTER